MCENSDRPYATPADKKPLENLPKKREKGFSGIGTLPDSAVIPKRKKHRKRGT